MRNCMDLKGNTYGRLVVIGLDEVRCKRKTYWFCRCACGKIKSVRSDSLKNGSIRSCGCLKKEQDVQNLDRTTHDNSGSRIYHIYQGMKSRCYNNSNKSYDDYGGRGIKICDEWLNDFEAFYRWALNNNYKETLTIDRIDNEGDYSPNNCRFATAKEQANNRRSNIIVKVNNIRYTLEEACNILDLPYGTISARHQRGIRGLELFKPIR